jgi:hypothetical protein
MHSSGTSMTTACGSLVPIVAEGASTKAEFARHAELALQKQPRETKISQ